MNTEFPFYFCSIILFCSTSALITVAIMYHVEPHDFYVYVIIALTVALMISASVVNMILSIPPVMPVSLV